ncbi:hypothetical protein [Intestinibacter sp.]|uniref:hypothetical protein n=1 Tax=Intestinibacter sp. TaxID=1965304 RepID=UPI002A75A25C|nr:hypothetical protein [Intestinibacter sp.]MDY2735757.1 hypothetical protein [Intestinibacter sp.]
MTVGIITCCSSTVADSMFTLCVCEPAELVPGVAQSVDVPAVAVFKRYLLAIQLLNVAPSVTIL